jgi:hypothetical protein
MFLLVTPVGCAEKKEDKPGLLTLLVEDCLKNPYIWLLAISYFFVYVVRQGVTSWFIFYLKARPWPASCSAHLRVLNATVRSGVGYQFLRFCIAGTCKGLGMQTV